MPAGETISIRLSESATSMRWLAGKSSVSPDDRSHSAFLPRRKFPVHPCQNRLSKRSKGESACQRGGGPLPHGGASFAFLFLRLLCVRRCYDSMKNGAHSRAIPQTKIWMAWHRHLLSSSGRRTTSTHVGACCASEKSHLRCLFLSHRRNPVLLSRRSITYVYA